jgi:hypothetical protein
MKFTAIEQEIIFLKASGESIGSMVNHEVLKLSEGDNGAQAMFKTSIHQRYFNIILVDFLSKSAEEVTGENISSLDALVKICEKPSFNQHNSVKSLRRAVKAFKKWLEHEIKVKVWFRSIKLKTKLKVQRQEIIKICGDMSKHTFSRLHVRARELKKILKRNGKEVSDDDGGLALLDDFYERFHTDIFTYQGSHIVEQLNSIRWGIQEYLQPELKRSMVYESRTPLRYRYTCPNGVNAEFVMYCYSALMNDIRATPNMKRFKTCKILTRRY